MRLAACMMAVGVLTSATNAQATSSVYADDLGKCLVAKTSDQDKIDMVRWVFAAISAHPAVATLAKVSQTDRDATNRTMATLFDRLLTADCRATAVAALKYEGPDSLKSSFGVLGQVAMGSIFNNPAVDTAMNGFADRIDQDKLAALFLEAGLKLPATPAK